MYKTSTEHEKTQVPNISHSDAGVNAAYHLSSIPYFEKPSYTIDRRENLFKVSIHADMVKIKRMDAPPPIHKKFRRGKVSGFSKKSRKRMIEMLASMVNPPTLFATLTFSDDVYEREDFDEVRYFELFRHWLEYRYQNIIAIWRKEGEPRKSGEFIGDYVPHFHLLIWLPHDKSIDLNSLLEDKGMVWREGWHKMIGSTHPEHLRWYGLQIEPIKSRRHAYHYASKYVGKASEDNFQWGRRWGTIGQVDTLPVFEMELSQEQYIHLKRLITSYAKKRKKYIGKKMARQSCKAGLTGFGLGAWNDNNQGLETSTIVKMIFHAIELANDKSKEKRHERTH